MAKRISVVLSQGQSANPAKREFEENLVAALLMERGVDMVVLIGAKEPVSFFAYPNRPGRLAPVKDPALLAKVIQATLALTDRIRFVIAGDGLDRDPVVSAVARFGGLFAPAIVAPVMATHFTLALAMLAGFLALGALRPFAALAARRAIGLVTRRARTKAFRRRQRRTTIHAAQRHAHV